MSRLKTNFSKCEIAELGSLREVLETLCGLKSINLIANTIKTLGVHFSYKSTIKVQNYFLDTVKTIQEVIRFLSSRMLSLGGKIVMFKRLYLIFFDYCSKLIDRITSKNPKKHLYGTTHIQKLTTKPYVTTLKTVG